MISLSQEDNKKRIAKNTLLLYIRMLVIMCIQLYTSRLVLKLLGVDDFGIYNVVGGIVAMFAFLNASLSSSTQRYITFYLGKGDDTETQTVFSNCLFIHALIAIIIVLLSETVGLWFLYNKMVIPVDRMDAAFWVFQMSILTTVILVFCYPYNAAIIAHEKMSAFAVISIMESILKLTCVLVLLFSKYDNLIIYSVLMVVAQLIVLITYITYCRRKFVVTKIVLKLDRRLFKSMSSFIGWNLWGGLSNVFYTQGLNILLNMFFGPAVNAARAIAVQVQGAVQQFTLNLQTAINPQITKSYAQGDLQTMHDLVFRSTRYTFFLLLTIALPLILESGFILRLWLTIVPDWTVIFLRIMICIVAVDSVAAPLMISSAATGNVKLYQTVIGGTMLLIVPFSYVFLKLGYNPTVVFIVHLVFCVITFVLRLFIVRPMINLSLSHYFTNAILPCIKSGIPASLLSIGLYEILERKTIDSVIVILCSICFSGLAILLLGLTNNEKKLLYSRIIHK